jgi:alkylation response protein AidB-like acyl-CoA dehydrogenase
MADLDTFRSEVRSWLEENAPPSLRGMHFTEIEGVWGGRRPEFAHPDQKVWLERMGARGWTAPTWPAEYGGGGLSGAEAKVLVEEMRSLKLPPALIGFGLTMIGPTLLQFGTDEQKKEHLPRIVRGEIRWCQGYSEPGAGSDLASLQCRAVSDGDAYILNGTRCGPRTRTSRTGSSRWCAPIPTPPSTTASRSCSATWRRPASASARSS